MSQYEKRDVMEYVKYASDNFIAQLTLHQNFQTTMFKYIVIFP